MRPSKDCLSLIKRWEGYHKRLPNGDCQAYPDPGTGGEPWTIGWGTTTYNVIDKYKRKQVRPGDTLTVTQAEQELMSEVDHIAKAINAYGVSLTQSQFDSAVSFAYNCGLYNRNMQRLKDGDLKGFEEKLPLYVKGGGRVLQGLVRRRKEELELWQKKTLLKDSAMEATWINLVRHENSKTKAPSYFLYAMNGSECIGKHEVKTRQDLSILLRRYDSAVNVAVGELNWDATPNTRHSTHATLTKTDEMLTGRHAGLRKLILEIAGHTFTVCSGQPYAQNFRKPQDPRSYPGNMEPLPSGVYKFNTTLPEMKGGIGDWNSVWSAGLGPMWDGLTADFSDDRGSFGCHYDGSVKGTAGCIGLLTIEDCKRYYDVRRSAPHVKEIHVDWGL